MVHRAVRALDQIARAAGRKEKTAPHLVTGRAGEELAYFRLRQLGYTVVARNWRVANCKGELDMIAWDGEVLSFVEVKTRTTHDVKPAEVAVDEKKRRELALMARRYLRRLRREPHPSFRFDVVSVYAEKGRPPEIILFKNAFSVP